MKAVCCLTLLALANAAVAAIQNRDLAASRTSYQQELSIKKLSRRTSQQNSVRAGSEQPAPARQNRDGEVQGDALTRANSEPARFTQADPKKSYGQESRKRERPSDSRSPVRIPRQRQSVGGSSPARPFFPHTGTDKGQSGSSHSESEDSSSLDSLSRSPSVGLLSMSTEHSSGGNSAAPVPHTRARANIRLYGPGVSVVAGSQMYPEYSNIRTGETTSHRIKDPHRAKAAGTSYEHDGAVVATARGKAVKAKVDARRSKQGGTLTTSWPGHEPWDISVKPGTVASVQFDDSHTNGQVITVKAALQGKGPVKASAYQDLPRPAPSLSDSAGSPDSRAPSV